MPLWCITQDNEHADGPWIWGPFQTQADAYNHAKRHALDWLQARGEATYTLTEDDPGEYLNIATDSEENHVWWEIKQIEPPKPDYSQYPVSNKEIPANEIPINPTQ